MNNPHAPDKIAKASGDKLIIEETDNPKASIKSDTVMEIRQ